MSKATKRSRSDSYYGADGRVDAVMAARLFAADLLFFNEGTFVEKNGRHEVTGLQFNSDKQKEYAQLMKDYQAFGMKVVELLRELDKVGELHVRREEIHEEVLPFLMNSYAEPLTGMTAMNLLAWHMMSIKQETSAKEDRYTVILDRNLVNGIPDAYLYAARFLRHLRLYNGKKGKFVVVFQTAEDSASSIEGVLSPVAGAADLQPDGYFLSVSSAGIVEDADGKRVSSKREQEQEKKRQEEKKQRELEKKKQKELEEKKKRELEEKKKQAEERKREEEKRRKEELREIIKQRDALIEKIKKRIKDDYEKKRMDFRKDIDRMEAEIKENSEKLKQAGFFQFSLKSSLKKSIAQLNQDIQQQEKLVEALDREEENDLKNPWTKVDLKERKKFTDQLSRMAQLETRGMEDSSRTVILREVLTVLGMEPMTASEINEALGTEYSVLMLSGTLSKSSFVSRTKVVRTTINNKGLKAEREFTGFYLDLK